MKINICTVAATVSHFAFHSIEAEFSGFYKFLVQISKASQYIYKSQNKENIHFSIFSIVVQKWKTTH